MGCGTEHTVQNSNDIVSANEMDSQTQRETTTLHACNYALQLEPYFCDIHNINLELWMMYSSSNATWLHACVPAKVYQLKE